MKKHLLSAAMLASFALGANAINVDDVVFSTTAKYKVTGADLVVNGQFANLTDGWKSLNETSATELFNLADGGGSIEAASAFDTATGIYQAVQVPSAGDYVVTMKVKSAAGGFTDIDLAGAGQNYITAVFSADGDIDAETNVIVGQTASFGTEWTDLTFGFNLEQDGTVFIVLKNLAAGVEISDVELHSAKELFDTRIAQRKLDRVQTYLDGFAFDDSYEGYQDLVDAATALKAAIENNSETEYETLVANLDGMWDLFLPNLTDVLYTINGAGKGDDCGNWNEWTKKYNKLNSEYTGAGGWTWTTDRWCHKTAAAYSPMSIQWMRGASGVWDNIATNTCTLDKGTYFFEFEGSGGMMTLDKNRWARSLAVECAETQMFFQNDTIDLGMLCPYDYRTYVHKFEVTEDGTEVKFGIRCNITSAVTDGFDVNFINPALYKVNIAGQLTEDEKAYLNNVKVQIEALENKIAEAEGENYLQSTEKPWKKEILTQGIAIARDSLAAYKGISQDELLDMMYNEISMKDTIMNNGVRNLQNNYMNVFNAYNTPLTNMPGAIAAATVTKNQRIYSGSAKMADLEAEIAKAQNMYEADLKKEFSAEDSLALVQEKAALADMVVAFQNGITATAMVDIDFGTQEAPAAFETTEIKDEEGEVVDTYYTVKGAQGEMKFTDITGSYCYALGYNETDSLGMLRVGNSKGVVSYDGTPAKATDIVKVSFDFYFGNLSGKSAGFYLTRENEEAKDTICGLDISKYSGTAKYNNFDVDYNGKINVVGSGSASNAAIAATNNATHFEIILDYGRKSMYMTTSGSKGTTDSGEMAMPTKDGEVIVPNTFFVTSDYQNADRRSWFDNLKIENIAAGETEEFTAVEGVASVEVAPQAAVKAIENGVLVIKTANGVFNVAGQQVK